MLAGYHDISTLHPPPIWEPFAVVQSRVASTLSFLIAIDFAVVHLGCMNLQSMTLNGELVFHVFPGTSVVSVLYPVPVRAFFFVFTPKLSAVAMKINRRLSMNPTILAFSFWAPHALITVVVDIKSLGERILIRVASLLDK